MKPSERCVDMIKRFEGCKLGAYKDHTGTWTIGYGHTYRVYKDMTISQAEADEFLRSDLISAEIAVMKFDPVYNWTQDEYDAMVSFAHNIGSLNKLTAKGTRTKSEIADAMLKYVKAGGQTLQGLVERRRAEYELFTGRRYDGPKQV